jgi:hypothetical protein
MPIRIMPLSLVLISRDAALGKAATLGWAAENPGALINKRVRGPAADLIEDIGSRSRVALAQIRRELGRCCSEVIRRWLDVDSSAYLLRCTINCQTALNYGADACTERCQHFGALR